jgi:hypothetical protein
MKRNWLKEEYIRPDFKKVWSGNLFKHAETQQGELYRNKEGRRTLSFEVNERSFFS